MKNAFISFLAALVLFIIACKKNENPPNVCINVDKTNVKIMDTVTVTACGDAPPTTVTVALNWGDGSSQTSGKTGSHQYKTAGSYNIELFINGDSASAMIPASQVKKTILVK